MRCLNGREETSAAAEGGFGRAWMGLDILETMARRYEGSFQAQQSDGVFSTTVILRAGAVEGDGCKTWR